MGTYLRRHFHSIAVANSGWQPDTLAVDEPLIIYANHPSWWDPLVAHYLNLKLFKPRQFYAPIDSAALEKYQVFAKLGFYGVNLSNHSGAAAFLKQSLSILEHPGNALWLTPEGRFCDCRDESATLMPGLPHLCTKMTRGTIVPMSLEYLFWEERLPECLVRFGTPFRVSDCSDFGKPCWTVALTDALRNAQRQLAADSIAREATRFDPILRGRSGAGGAYDLMRRLKSLIRGKEFRSEHGEKLQ